ncbi:MAG: DUF2202 domain-containing protein [Anaerolineales bacterium]|jgi:hypothetical protein
MMKKIIGLVLLVGLIGALLIGAVNRTMARTAGEGNYQGGTRAAADGTEIDSAAAGLGRNAQEQDFQGNGYGRATNGRDSSSGPGQSGGYGQGTGNESGYHEYTPESGGVLSESEQQALIFMREEEKLAHDIYVAMYESWGLPIFQNISSSEQSHTEAVKTLLDRYDIPDPASSEPGVFSNPDLQDLYDELLAQGSQSLAEALRVGAAIEEIDILDLQERLAATSNSDIQQVFNNLLQGSINHLKAFTSTLMTQTGETYQPQFMTLEEYQAIIAGSNAVGNQGNGMRGSRGGRP